MLTILSVRNNRTNEVHIFDFHKVNGHWKEIPMCNEFAIQQGDSIKTRLKTQITCKNCLRIQKSRENI
jgi:hypothetical protein